VPEELITVAEAARRIGVSAKVVQTLLDHEQLPGVPVGSRVRIPAAAVDAYAEAARMLGDQAAALVRASYASAVPRPPTSKDSVP
jgi:excisionase family DNA binding protein